MESIAGSRIFTGEQEKIAGSVSKNNASVLLTGEKGTGKSLFAEYIHYLGNNSSVKFYSFDCKSFCEQTAWNELLKIVNECNFLSDHVTLYFNRVEKLPLEIQSKLVLLIKDSAAKNRNLRFIFSSEADLEERCEDCLFLKDLYFLISTVLINLIPLRQRKEHILEIAGYFLNQYKRKYSSDVQGFSESARNDMMNCFWTANVAELRNSVERGVLKAEDSFVQSQDLAILPNDVAKAAEETVLDGELSDKSLKNALDSFKKAYLIKILQENNWNQTKTAKVLGIQRTYIIRLINELQIRTK